MLPSSLAAAPQAVINSPGLKKMLLVNACFYAQWVWFATDDQYKRERVRCLSVQCWILLVIPSDTCNSFTPSDNGLHATDCKKHLW